MTINLIYYFSTILLTNLISNCVVPLRIGPVVILALTNTGFYHHNHHHHHHDLKGRFYTGGKTNRGCRDSTKKQIKTLRNRYCSSFSSVTDLMAILEREEKGYNHTSKIQSNESEIDISYDQYDRTDTLQSQLDESDSNSDENTEEEEEGKEEEVSVTEIMDLFEEEEMNYSNNQYGQIDIIKLQVDETKIDSDYGMEEEEEDDLFISDAEALLACFSHLKRRKLYGNWTEYEQRQAQKALSQNIFLPDDDDIVHYDSEDDDDDVDDDDDDDYDGINEYESSHDNDDGYDDEWSSCSTSVQDVILACSSANDIYESRSADDIDMDYVVTTDDFANIDTDTTTETVRKGKNYPKNKNIGDDLWYKEFTSFPTKPSDSRIRRVEAIRKRWKDPIYRERWYRKRWGSLSNHQQQKQQHTARESRAVVRAREIPSDFLSSDELGLMKEEEIANVIMTRLQSTRKRVATRKQTLQQRQEVLAAQMRKAQILPEYGDYNDKDKYDEEETLYPTKAQMEEVQRKNSERAKRLYATRLKNQEMKNQTAHSPRKNKSPFFPPKQLTPRDALLRIENSLDSGEKPSLQDVKLILLPRRMRNRKLILRRILQDEFNLRGKSVPPIYVSNGGYDNDGDDYELDFDRQCSIERVGAFVISLLEK